MQSQSKRGGIGEVAEWSIAAVLKTVELRGSGGSNPSLSAEKRLKMMIINHLGLFSFYIPPKNPPIMGLTEQLKKIGGAPKFTHKL